LTEADDRDAALAAIVRLAAAHRLTPAEVAAAIAAAPDGNAAAAPSRQVSALSRLLAYLGATFTFAGIGIFVAIEWSTMTSAARVVATLGAGLAAFAMGMLAVRDSRFAIAATPLFVLAAALEPLGILVAFDEYAGGGDWRHAVLAMSGAMALQQLAAFWALRRTALLFFTLLFGAAFAATGMDILGLDGGLIGLTVGASLVSLAAAIDRTGHAPIAPYAHFIGSGVGLAGAFDLLVDTAAEPLFLGAACGVVYLSTHLKSRALLIVATAAILGYIAYFTADRFADAVGWPLALIAFGLALIGASAAAVRINRRYIAPGRAPP